MDFNMASWTWAVCVAWPMGYLIGMLLASI